MSAPSVPQNFYVQQANGVILVSWSQSPGAASYIIQRSLDNVTYTNLVTISGSPLATSYLDTTVTLSIAYYYQVSADNGANSGYTLPLSAVPSPTGEKTLGQIRLAAQQRADKVNSNSVTLPEWNSYINQAMFELYDLLVTVYEDYYCATPIQFTVDGSTFLYPLPNGSNTFQNALNAQTFTPRPYYKLLGVDLGVQTSTNAFVTVNKFNFADRNKFLYPNSASTIYGVFNLQYRVMGSNIEFIPTPSANQVIRLWYIPRLKELLADTDITESGINGWLEYVIVRAAKYALDKEESDSSQLTQEISFLKTRIEESASNRDAGMPDKISDTNMGNWGNGWRGNSNGGSGGY